jgi:site-specific DNA-methyltransferase (adenine-specific)
MLQINEIYDGDCVKLMSYMEDDRVDLTVTSPPYDKLRDYKGYNFNFRGVANELYRVTKPGGVVVWVVGDSVIDGSETGSSFRQALYFKSIGFNLHDTMIYQKPGGPYPETVRYYQSFEYMFVFSKGKPKTVNLIRDRKNIYAGAKVARKHHARKKEGEVLPNYAYTHDPDRRVREYGVRFNIWRIPSSSSKGDKLALKHPATFPEQLANDHIITWSNPGDLVLDPMCGSGTTLKMAKLNDRYFIGMDYSEEYCRLSKERLTGVFRKEG